MVKAFKTGEGQQSRGQNGGVAIANAHVLAAIYGVKVYSQGGFLGVKKKISSQNS